MTYYIFLESAGQNLVNGRYCNRPSIINAALHSSVIGWPCWGRTKSKLNINGGRIKFVNNFYLSKYNVISIVKSNKYLGNLPVTVRDIYNVTLVSGDNNIHRDYNKCSVWVFFDIEKLIYFLYNKLA